MRHALTWLMSAVFLCAVGRAEEREWSDASGKFSITAELISSDGGEVKLRRNDGIVITVPLGRLSQSDQDFVRNARQSVTSARDIATLAQTLAKENGDTEVGILLRDQMLLQVAVAFAHLGDIDEAKDTLRHASNASIPEELRQKHADLAVALAKDGHASMAKRLLRDLSPLGQAEVHTHTAIAYADAGDKPRATGDVQRAFQLLRTLNGPEPMFLPDFVRVASRLGMEIDATKIVVRYYPQSSPFMMAQVCIGLAEAGSPDQAEQIYRRINQGSADAGIAAIAIARAYALEGKFEDARRVRDRLELTGPLLPHHLQTLGAIAESAHLKGDQEHTKEFLSEAALLTDRFEGDIYKICLCYLIDANIAAGDFDQAKRRITWVEKTLEKDGVAAMFGLDSVSASALLTISRKIASEGNKEASLEAAAQAEQFLKHDSEAAEDEYCKQWCDLGNIWASTMPIDAAISRAKKLENVEAACVMAGIARTIAAKSR